MDTEANAIIREIAESDPMDGLVNELSGPWCRWSNGAGCQEPFDDPANHAESCLWRRARELYPKR